MGLRITPRENRWGLHFEVGEEHVWFLGMGENRKEEIVIEKELLLAIAYLCNDPE